MNEGDASDEDGLRSWRDRRTADYARKRPGLPLREESIIAVDPGEPGVDTKMVVAGDVGLLRVGVDVSQVNVSVFDPDCTRFALSGSWSGDYFVNGDPAGTSALYMPGDLDSFQLRSDGRVTLGVAFP